MAASKLTENATTILEGRYLVKAEKTGEFKETPSEMFGRVAKAIASCEHSKSDRAKYEKIYYDMMWSLDFMPNSPTLMNAGTGTGTLSACYVLPLNDSMDSIMTATYDQAMIEKYGGGVGFPLSNIRPEGTPIRTTQGQACGPINVLKTLSQVGTMITQGGKRDGAHMAIMSVFHPDIEKFITCKSTEGDIHNFNISVGANSEFMEAVNEDKYLHLTWPLDEKSYSSPQSDDGKWIKARAIFSQIIHGAWRNGEPGMVWLDRINEDNATPNVGVIEATNPCGEQPLLGNESCNLGSINVANFVLPVSNRLSNNMDAAFDILRFEETVKNAVRFLDSVVDANSHPTESTTLMNSKTRKIGLGIMGWADLLYQLGIPYNSEKALMLVHAVGDALATVADETSADLAVELGNFPEFESSPLNKQNGGKWNTMRNAWRLSIAPTGTIAMIADTSASIEPNVFLVYTKKNLSTAYAGKEFVYINKYFLKALDDLSLSPTDKEEIIHELRNGKTLQSMSYDVEGFTNLKNVFLVAGDVAPADHVQVQAAFQKYVDSGISKTINLPNESSEEVVSAAYMLAWELGCKGITVYRDGSREKEVLTAGVSNGTTPHVNGSIDEDWIRPHEMSGVTSKIQTGHGSLYVTMNKDSSGQIKEVVAWTGKSGACEHAASEAFGRLISTAIQFGVPMPVLVNQLKDIECCPQFFQGRRITSPPDGIAQILESTFNNGKEEKTAVATIPYPVESVSQVGPKQRCPDCSSVLLEQSGCSLCSSCGWSKCG